MERCHYCKLRPGVWNTVTEWPACGYCFKAVIDFLAQKAAVDKLNAENKETK